MRPPLCRTCGKPIPKKTVRHWFGRSAYRNEGFYVDHPEKPHSKAEVQRLTNDQVVSIRKYSTGEIYAAGTWDGESYVSEYFCTDGCARSYGYFAVRCAPELRTKSYADAAAAQDG